jgi:hypothetical protein
MARRSYLQRIAEPITAADQVLWPIPLPNPEDIRPAVLQSATPAAPEPWATELRGAEIRPAAPPTLRRRMATVAATEPPIAARSQVLVARSAARAADTLAASARPSQKPDAAPAADDPESIPLELASPTPIPRPESFRADAALAAVPPESYPKISSSVRPQQGQTSAFDVAADEPPPFEDAMSHAPPSPPFEPAPRPRGGDPLPGSEPASPRLHIGTIEIRTSAPPAAAPAVATPAPSASPARPSQPASRGYAWRYGLIQG